MEEYNNFENSSPQPDNSGQPLQTPPQSSAMATASLVIGICSLVLICCGGSILLGGLGMILALLSRGTGRMNGSAKAGLGLSIAGLSIGIVVYTFYFFSIIASGQFYEILNSYSYYYDRGDNYNNSDDYLNDLLDRYNSGEYDYDDNSIGNEENVL